MDYTQNPPNHHQIFAFYPETGVSIFWLFDFDQTSQQREEEEEIVIRDRLLLTAAPSWTALESLSPASVTRSHRGHMFKAEVDDGFRALSSSTSICSRRFCSFNDPNHLFRYSHSISVCFSLLLHIKFCVTIYCGYAYYYICLHHT